MLSVRAQSIRTYWKTGILFFIDNAYCLARCIVLPESVFFADHLPRRGAPSDARQPWHSAPPLDPSVLRLKPGALASASQWCCSQSSGWISRKHNTANTLQHQEQASQFPDNKLRVGLNWNLCMLGTETAPKRCLRLWCHLWALPEAVSSTLSASRFQQPPCPGPRFLFYLFIYLFFFTWGEAERGRAGFIGAGAAARR